MALTDRFEASAEWDGLEGRAPFGTVDLRPFGEQVPLSCASTLRPGGPEIVYLDGPKPPGGELDRSVEVHIFGSAGLEGGWLFLGHLLTKRPHIDGSAWRPPLRTTPLGRCLKPIG